MLAVENPANAANLTFNIPYPAINGGGYYPIGAGNNVDHGANVLMVYEVVATSIRTATRS